MKSNDSEIFFTFTIICSQKLTTFENICDYLKIPFLKRFDGVCDKDGCDFASYRYGDQNYWGKGSGFTINTETKKITVVTQFITHDGTDNGDLVEVRRFYRLILPTY